MIGYTALSPEEEPTMRSLVASLSFVAVLSITGANLAAQRASAPRIHTYLEQQLDQAQPEEHLPVYFVMADQLGYDHWFPRVTWPYNAFQRSPIP